MKNALLVAAALACLAASQLARQASAGEPLSFHCGGTGVFSPTNIGTAKGGNAGIIIGDGSGSSEYLAFGDVFTIGGEPVGSGSNMHIGEAVSRTTGIQKAGQSLIRWPVHSGVNHVLVSDEGDIEFRYTGGYTLDLAAFAAGEPSFTGDGVFIIVGGTGRFEGAAGIVWVDVTVPFALPALPPPGVSPDIPFVYDFNGFIVLDE